jgi:hypothetical protein
VVNVIAASLQAQESRVMKEQTGTTDQPENQHESTYALLIRSEEKSRNVIEMAICPILILGAVIAIWQFAQQPVSIPSTGLKGADCVVCVDEVKTLHEPPRPEIRG